ncbi:hypothetical protein [Haloprofundus salinisoli]|uniref:hypothetical protein n=1 Tax=Haloprofundus salinisoli TaxID=2876193 RepID=UPI001CCFBB2A|nr:hypothetical protein [Haloprofundus salinisoli]
MPLSSARRDALRVCGVVLGLGIAGCTQTTPTDAAGNQSARDESSVGDPSTTEPTAVPASVVSDEEAKERALEAEKAHITEQLENASCVSGWGPTAPTGVEKRAVVIDRTADGVHVEVTHPYWYSTDDTEADVGSDARYAVTDETVRRVSGDDVAPC